MSKTKLTATDSFSETFTRTTARDYKFVVVTRADQRIVEICERHLAADIARLDEIGTEGIERAAQEWAVLDAQETEALAANDFRRAREINEQMYDSDADMRLAKRLARHERDLQKAKEDAAAKNVLNVTWTSRHDLAIKIAAKDGSHGSVEIVPVG